MFTVEIEKTEVRKSKAGKDYEVCVGYVMLPGFKYPQQFECFAPYGQKVAPGKYTVGLNSLKVGDYKKLELSSVFELTPAK